MNLLFVFLNVARCGTIAAKIRLIDVFRVRKNLAKVWLETRSSSFRYKSKTGV